MPLNVPNLQRLAPRPSAPRQAAIWDGYIKALVERGPFLLAKYRIEPGLELCHLLAQWAHESGGFTVLREDMSYTARHSQNIRRWAPLGSGHAGRGLSSCPPAGSARRTGLRSRQSP
jgi:predicted chitinase